MSPAIFLPSFLVTDQITKWKVLWQISSKIHNEKFETNFEQRSKKRETLMIKLFTAVSSCDIVNKKILTGKAAIYMTFFRKRNSKFTKQKNDQTDCENSEIYETRIAKKSVLKS